MFGKCFYEKSEVLKISLKIRLYRKEADIETFVRIFNAAFADYEDMRTITTEARRETEEKAPSYNTEGLLIAEWNNQPVGMINAFVDKFREEPKGFIQEFAVLPRWRRKGIGRKLLNAALRFLKERGMRVVHAWAESDREECIRLFESSAFKPIRVTCMMKRPLAAVSSDVGENKGVAIRKMAKEDENEIILLNRLDNETFVDHFNYRPRTVEETRYGLLESKWFRDQEVILSMLSGQTVGYAIAGIDTELNKEKNLNWGWILDIGVLKSHRRKGIGTRLMLHLMEILVKKGMTEAVLYVDETNPTKAIRLYEKLGFRAARKHLIYEKTLA